MGIERYRAIVRLEEIRSLMEQGEYDAAKQTADSICKERLRDSADLFLLASVYRKCGEFGMAKEFLMRIYEKKVTWRVLEELMEVCLAERNPDEAEQYLKQYVKLSGGDPRNYIYEYRIGRQKHRPDEELLPVLQTLKAEEYSEKYAYELAKLYHKLGRGQECMEECRDLILWFGEGTYVERAKVLQAYYRGELSAEDIRVESERRRQEADAHRTRKEYFSAGPEGSPSGEEEYAAVRPEGSPSGAKEYAATGSEGSPSGAKEYAATGPEGSSSGAEEYAAARTEGSPSGEEEYAAARTEEEPLWEERAFEAAKEPELSYEGALAEETVASERNEPMWEKDASAFVSLELQPEVQKEVQEEPEAYEQISLFEPQEDVLPEEPQSLSPLGGELSARLSERGLVFEEVLHEFARIERVRKQLVRMLEVVVTVRKKCHCLIITGETKSGKTTLGTYLAKLLYELSYVKSPRVAKISAARLNQINLYEKKEQLQDTCLIVERAGEMTETTAEALLDFIRHTDVLGAVVLEDNANAINRLLRNHAECNRIFNNRVHLPKYDSGELMGFALGYIRGQDYEISGEVKRLLGEKIKRITRAEPKEGRLGATLELVREALKNADYRNQGTILAMASAGNFLAAEALELTAEDFGIIR